ncbi:hypothetical protein Tsubulata_024526 [Turnera subulata]|uniref:Chloroplast envelope membrane protein n=1 Tax=Turnera subulata TaxID=218843 RepID=A0A9Q0J4E0_9ROSI|nr:hypothetical protein Tsubulata_024526 [Turnera subulata]
MSTSMVLVSCENLIFAKGNNHTTTSSSSSRLTNRRRTSFLLQLSRRRQVFKGLVVTNAKKRLGRSRRRSWWQRLFSDEGAGDWLDEDIDILADEEEEGEGGEEKFEAWRRRAEAIMEIREAQEGMLNEESRRWEDWITDANPSSSSTSSSSDYGGGGYGGVGIIPPPEKGFGDSVRDLVLGPEDEDLLYEDRVFRYASSNSAKFLAVLIIIPWILDVAVHEFVFMPFLDRYTKTVPLAARILDVRNSQKLKMAKDLKMERVRLLVEADIGRSPPLTDEELWWELRHKALELRDEWRLENRNAFANILSDMVFGMSFFIILCWNQDKVALLKFTGYKVLTNTSDEAKALLLILVADSLLGYHSEVGWYALVELILDHYGFEIDRPSVIIFVSVFPIFVDSCGKLWVFKNLTKYFPNTAAVFEKVGRH